MSSSVRLGSGPNDLKEIKLLNRVLRVTETGLLWEADPKLVGLLAKALSLEEAKDTHTPGVKMYSDGAIADGQLQQDDEARKDVLQVVHALVEQQPRTPNRR